MWFGKSTEIKLKKYVYMSSIFFTIRLYKTYNISIFSYHCVSFSSFSPTDSKFTSCSDDRTVRIFDFATCTEEYVLQGTASTIQNIQFESESNHN